MPTLTLGRARVPFQRDITPPEHSWCPEPQFFDCAECKKRSEALDERWNEERRQEKKIIRMVMSSPMLYRIGKLFRHVKTFDDADYPLYANNQVFDDNFRVFCCLLVILEASPFPALL